MRPQAANAEWNRWKIQNPDSLDLLRSIVRMYCDGQIKKDPTWQPRKGSQLVPFLRDLDIDDEYIKIQPHCFITVRLPRTMDIKESYGKIKDLKYGWLQNARAVIEGYGTPNPHCHILVVGQPHKGNCIKQLANRFGIQKAMVDFKRSDSPELWATRVSYIEGTKVEEKAEKVEADKAYRNAHNIPHLIKF